MQVEVRLHGAHQRVGRLVRRLGEVLERQHQPVTGTCDQVVDERIDPGLSLLGLAGFERGQRRVQVPEVLRAGGEGETDPLGEQLRARFPEGALQRRGSGLPAAHMEEEGSTPHARGFCHTAGG